ncbi:MAG: hypothetical protein O2963_00360 [Proteobacteria bacterium]|nr:hypothetical protein [Pseudomonadota bacterium]
MSNNKEQLQASINAIESGYEFMLAYAAQGRDFEHTSGGGGPSIRVYLNNLNEGLNVIGEKLEKVINDEVLVDRKFFTNFLDILKADAARSEVAVEMIISLPSIGSQAIDNLNASIHLRALLTDIFLIDEALSSLSRKPPQS